MDILRTQRINAYFKMNNLDFSNIVVNLHSNEFLIDGVKVK